VAISSTFYEQLLGMKLLITAFFLITILLYNFLAKEYWHKSCSSNVGKLDYWAQFHQHLTHTFFVQQCFAQLFSSHNLAL